MSLIVWCPLINDLHNQGISSTNLSGGGSFVSSGGKIGSGCFHLTTGGTWVTIPELVDKQAFSICCWVKIVTSETFTNWADCWVVEANADGSLLPCRLERGRSSDSATLLLWLVARNDSSASYKQISSTSSDNAWVHTVLTYDGTNFKSYANGILRTTVAKSSFATSFKLSGRVRLGDSNSSTYLNDFRIYDRALSEQEIKELSKGLVCHYTLGSESLTTSSNLITGLSGGTQCTISGSTVNISGTNSDTYFYIKTAAALTEGKLYRLSCYGSGFPSGAYYNFPVGASSNTSQGYIKVLNGYCELVFTCNSTIVNAGTNILMDDNGKSAGTGTISNIDLREYTGVADSSGYCNNGTISGNPSLDSNTPRYNKALLFPANSESTITTPLSIDNSAWTISFWEKCDWTNVETSSPYIVYWENYIRIRKHSTSGRMRALYYYKDSEGTQASTQLYFMSAIGTDTSWKHFVLTFDGSTLKTYLNGTLSASSNLPSGFSLYDINGNFILNYTAETISKSLSDVRVYATALSADDVTELYNLGA